MNTFLEVCVMSKFDIDGMEPTLTTLFTAIDVKNNGTFDYARNDIRTTSSFTEQQIDHFDKCLDYLAHCRYPLIKYESVHIVGSNINENKHYVQINNTAFENNSNNNPMVEHNISAEKPRKKYSLYINYKPELFNSKWLKLVSPLSFFPKSNRKGITNGVLVVSNIFTIFNCFTYALLYNIYKNPAIIQKLIDHPFHNSFIIIIEGVFYSSVGVFISNISPFHSNIVFNGIIGYINYNIFKTISK
jgi:hypothetical protein